MPEGSHSALYEVPMGEGGLTGSVLYKLFLRPSQEWLIESPRLSTASSVSSNERLSAAIASDCSVPLGADFPHGERPVSLVSTLSSGSSRDGQSLYGSTAALPDSDVDLDFGVALRGARGQTQQLTGPVEAGREEELAPCSTQYNNNAIPAESGALFHPPLSPFAAKAMAPNPKLTYLDRVVMEIIETERMYVRDLRSIVEDYLAHIIDTDDLPIGPEQVCALFGNIEDIYEFNSELLQSLDMCENNPVAIARCFVDKSEYFEIYTQYCTNYPNSVAALTDCMRNKTLAKFFRERQASLKRSLPLGSYLLKPVQRILKYHLLLQEIAKHFDHNEEGYEVVEEAIDTMTGVAWYINDMKRKHEHAVRLQEVQSLLINWKGPDLTTYGELVLEGTFRVHRAKNERILFLFDKMLLITKKRGEHYVYKTHISCSTLMLIESTKDSLCFSVTHFKHPKQPHTVQAKTVEEKRLWAHHIKRLILENHHAIIPQKAKEAILEMDSIYPTKYRYSPERLKKAVSCQSDDFPTGGRQGRRRSEPAKQIVKNTKAILKHADSEGALQADRRSLQAGASVSTLGSSQGEPESERPSMEEEEVEEELGIRKNLLARLSPSDNEEPGPGAQPCGGRVEQEEEGESNEDDILMGDDQDEEMCDVAEENGLKRQSSQSSGQEDASEIAESEPLAEEQVPAEQLQRHNDAPELGVSEEEMEDASEFELAASISHHGNSETLEPCEEQDEGEETREELLVPQPLEEKSLSSGETSQDEEEEEEVGPDLEPARILPPSVLDQASVIAERFANNLSRRESLLTDETRSVSCSSPRPASRSRCGSSLSISTEAQEKANLHPSTSSEQLQDPTTPGTEPTTFSPSTDNIFEIDRGSQRRRDSTLSKRDQLLIDKIRSYYEHAEHQDASFSLKRRESLTYIPVGLVRNLSSRLNSIPKVEEATMEKKSTPSTRPPSWTVFNLPGLNNDQRRERADSKAEKSQRTKPPAQEVSEIAIGDEEFRPSSEMIKVWQNMENDLVFNDPSKEHLVSPKAQEVSCSSQSLSLRSLPNNSSQYSEPLLILEDPDLSTISEESSTVSPLRGSEGVGAGLVQTDGPQEDGRVPRAPIPRVITLGTEVEEELLMQDMEKMKNKVFQLARQYSQRIKNSHPMVRQRIRETESQLLKKNLPSVQEERSDVDDKGKPPLTLSLNMYEQVILQELRSPSPTHTPSPTNNLNSGSPRVLSPSQSSRSPLSPVQTESFHWPDVRELRSKYTQRGSNSGAPRLSAVSRSCSVPEKILDCSSARPRTTWRHSSYSSTSSPPPDSGQMAPSGCQEFLAYRPHSSVSPTGDSHTQLFRSGSLNHKGQVQQDQETNSHYYISAQSVLPNDHKIIVVEKAGPWEGRERAGIMEEEEHEEEANETYIQIRSPTTKDKISIMAVIDRCKAYQESEEYRQREEGQAKAEQASRGGRSSEQDQCLLTSEQLSSVTSSKKTESSPQSLVKNLRDKFQNLGSNS
ncbi:pleckstrin homology domain-containing family G member 3 isoform X2 [Scleropages formosus]|uniref:pleckstrin homology domain-containing family G member 3 isoform X2 n=1 Tax=Scleropages formosus TaxID=113540 RepID=UPI000878BAB2|nr:pleckstrin homology domain-containing family G member 3 isoform X2 [Scleropages formosus]XP_018583107.1 pleckstrin homology domain-containing family G member 3 isoform X2 [Scleropages formosus]